MSLAVATGPADLRDQRWLDERIAAITDGIEAVLDIARDWTEGRNLSRLHPGVSAQEYVLAHVKHPLGRGVVEPLLAESNWSNRQIAAVAGVSPQTVGRIADTTVPSGTVDRPAETLGADGKLRPRVVRAEVIDTPPEEEPIDDRHWRSLASVLDAIEALAVVDAPDIAATIPHRRRAATARRIRKLGTFLGGIAWTLEGEESADGSQRNGTSEGEEVQRP